MDAGHGMTHTWTRVAAAAAVAGLLVAGCGGSESAEPEATTTPDQRARLVKAGLKPPSGCYLTVFLSETVTPGEKQGVQSMLLASERVTLVAFVPRELAFRRFKRARPVDARHMTRNPFYDRFEVVPGTKLDVFGIITEFAPGIDGVTNVRPTPPCGTV
jgi:hypothetical protein